MRAALAAKLTAARATGVLARASGRGGGTSLPGKVLLALEPHAIGELASRLENGTVEISATNGKTTTAAMAASILERAGHRLVHNRAGANMAGGIAATLLSANRGDTIDGDLGLFEVDEFWLRTLTAELRPRVLVLANLFRDQLDRYGELETIATRWAEVIAALPDATTLVLNADDPLVADLGRDLSGVRYFGIEDPAVADDRLAHAADSKHCRRCGAPYRYEAVYVGHLGSYHCPDCGLARPRPQICAQAIELHGTERSRFILRAGGDSAPVSLSLPGLYNVYNALAAATLCLALGIPFADVVAGLESTTAAFGRAETLTVDGCTLQLLLIKNPVGANEVLRTLALAGEPLHLLAILNDRVADGRDISWIWDADFELIASRVDSAICAGRRAGELAVRLKYAGVDVDRLTVVPELPAALDAALARAPGGRVHALPTYTALLDLREELTRRGLLHPYWRSGA